MTEPQAARETLRPDPLTPGLAERIAGAIADISEEWAESAEWLAARIMERLNDPDALPLRAATPDRAASTVEPGLDTFDDVMRLAARLEAEVHAGTLPIDAIGVEGILRSLAKMLDPDRYRALRPALTPDETA